VTIVFKTGNMTPNGQNPYTQVGEVNISLISNAPIGAKYGILIQAGVVGVNLEVGTASRLLTSIPEFPTVALPVAGVIGLVYLLNFRKKKQ